jgi:hypothetical protein
VKILRSPAAWYGLWSAMLLVSVGNALLNIPALSSSRGLVFSWLLAAVAGTQMLVGGARFLGRRIVALSVILLIVFAFAQGAQRIRATVPGPSSRGADFCAYYIAGKFVSPHPVESLYQLPFYADGRMNLQAMVPVSSAWHAASMDYQLPYSAPFIYPPFFAVLMKPLSHLSYAAAFAAWSMLSTLLMLAAVLLSLDLGGVRVNGKLALMLGVGVFCYYPILDDLYFGQIGGMILFLVAAAAWLLVKKRDWLSAFCLAAATLIKLTPVLVVPVLVFHRRWKWLGAYVAWMIGLLAFSVWQAGWAMHLEYWRVVMPSISCGAAVCQNSSIMAYVQELFLGHVALSMQAPQTIPPYACAVSRWVSLAVYGWILFRCYLRRRDGLVVRDLAVMALLGIVVSPISWWHHYTLGLLPFLYLWGKRPEKGNRLLLVLFLAVATNAIGIVRIAVMNHVWQLILAAILPALTIAVAYRSLSPGAMMVEGEARVIDEAEAPVAS